jgi:tripartite-type tricarboxylate transporter receptor subunit TctC
MRLYNGGMDLPGRGGTYRGEVMMKLLMAAACAALLHSADVKAQAYPAKPITVVVPFAAGGPADALARTLGERMRPSLGQPFVIENVVGAAGSTGVGRLVRAAPDGYTIGIGHLGTHVLNGVLYALPYDLVADMEPIALLMSTPSVIVSRKDVPASDMKELIAWLKANPQQASSATAGVGSIAHVASVYFERLTGVTLQVVPYRSGAAATNDVVAGHVAFMFDQAASNIELRRSGKVRSFAVAAKTRLPAEPELPTVDEAGLPGLYVSTWYALWAPKGTPKDIIARLNAAVTEAMADPGLRKRLQEQNAELPSREQQSPEGLAAFHKSEIEKWWPIVKAANIKVE